VKRVFLVGLGPSVRPEQLDLLIGEEAWGMNRVHLIYDKMKWRPTRYFWTDMPQDECHLDDIQFHLELGENVWLRDDVANWKFPTSGRGEPAKLPNVTTWNRCVAYSHGNAMHKHPWKPKDWSCVTGTWGTNQPLYCKYGSGTSVMVQIAVNEGFEEIYLVGSDLGFKPLRAGETENAHMVPGYWPTKTVDYTQERADLLNGTLWEMHDMIAKETAARGISVFNCSPISPLTQYPRVRLEDVCGSGSLATDPASGSRRSTPLSAKRLSASTGST
jgi:hypothetical protein